MTFKKATKMQAKLRMAIDGPSGSGKTYTSLAIATALGGPIAVVDTEHGSASKYADLFNFDVVELDDYHPDHYVEALHEAARLGYRVVVLDSLSHAWSGKGGALELKENITKRKTNGNSYTAWADVTPIQNRMIDAIIAAPMHVITTMRSKQEYILETNERGKQAPKKVGLAPVQRDGVEYEFDVWMSMDLDNNGVINKTRCPKINGGVYAKPGKDLAGILGAWLSDGEEAPMYRPAQEQPPALPLAQPPDRQIASINLQRIKSLWIRTGKFYSEKEAREIIVGRWGVTSTKELTPEQQREWEELIMSLENGPAKREDYLPKQPGNADFAPRVYSESEAREIQAAQEAKRQAEAPKPTGTNGNGSGARRPRI